MARGIPSPATNAALPKISFVKVHDDVSTQPAGVHDHQARSYGYNDFSDFKRPDHYIRHIEPLESELAVQVEYDMDEQDKEWLDTINAERKKEQLNKVSYEVFEIIMDRLEKEWFDLTKNLPKHDFALPSEDSTCAICDDPEGENSNAIVFCDGCNLAVHQDCYGVPYIPEGQWLCRKCTVSPENPVSCILCPNEGGAFKQTIMGEWVHLLCAIWVPETRVVNDVFMEPITGADKISKQRWKLKCSICEIRQGACIQCAKTSCFLAFHATCARKEKFLMPMKNTQGSEPVTLSCYCEKHLPKQQLEARAQALEKEGSEDEPGSTKHSKSARAYAKTYKPGPPLVPALIVERILTYITKVIIRKKVDFLHMMCRYWSLKREARRGAPLLKRLHLEPWTAFNNAKTYSEEEKSKKLEYLQRLRDDLGKVLDLLELTRKRETRKLRQTEVIQGIISQYFFPHEPPLRLAFEKIVGLDRQEYFKNPVSQTEVPDYFEVITKPMCWNTIDAKLDSHEYWDLQTFKDDIYLVLDNAIQYNKPGTPFHKAALKMRQASTPILDELDHLASSHAVPSDATEGNGEGSSSTQLPHPIGSLEPPLEILELLLNSDMIKDDTDFILEEDPFTSLFNFELGKLKPPRVMPPPPEPAKPRVSSWSERKAAQAAKRLAKAAEITRALDATPGFRAPRTRRAIAAAAAFEMEAQGQSESSGDPSSSTNLKGGKWKRGPLVLPGQSEVPPIVDDVDKQRSFAMFDEGWILPPDYKRGGRVPTDRESSQGKIFRTDSGAPLSTPAAESQPSQSLPPEAKVEPELPQLGEAGSAPEDMDVYEDQLTAGQDHVIDETHISRSVVESGVIIIEELDSPSIRREKNMRRKAEKLRAALSMTADSPAVSTLSPVAGPSRLPATAGNAVDSDLSSLSESDGDDAHHGARTLESKPTKVRSNVGSVKFPLEGGTLVWAKAETYPWWPAVIYEDDDTMIPNSVLKQRRIVSRRIRKPIQLVQFFDKSSSWQWLDASRLKHLGDDKQLDEDLLATTSKLQRWKTPAVRQDCRAAYRRAIAEMELDPEGDTAAVIELAQSVHDQDEGHDDVKASGLAHVPAPAQVPDPDPDPDPELKLDPEAEPEPELEPAPEPEPQAAMVMEIDSAQW